MLDFLSQYRWWRRFKGGIWWKVDYRACPEASGWDNVELLDANHYVIDYENYTKREGVRTFPEEGEFLQQIKNIARNGQWKDRLHLMRYLKMAIMLRELVVDDRLIITKLTELYVSAFIECNANLTPYDYDAEEIKEMVKR